MPHTAIAAQIPDLDAIRDAADPRTSHPRPIPPWRVREHAYFNLIAWERLVREVPGGPIKDTETREWNLYGGRIHAPIPDDHVLTRNVGPHDVIRNVRHW